MSSAATLREEQRLYCSDAPFALLFSSTSRRSRSREEKHPENVFFICFHFKHIFPPSLLHSYSHTIALIFTLLSGAQLIIAGTGGFLEKRIIKLPLCGWTAVNFTSYTAAYIAKMSLLLFKANFTYLVLKVQLLLEQ